MKCAQHAAPVRDFIHRWIYLPLNWIAGVFGYEYDLDATCDFCGAEISRDNTIRHIRTFHPEEAKALEPEWKRAGVQSPEDER